MTCKLIEVIQTDVLRGKGTENDPYRTVMQYWSKDGKLLAEDDPCALPAEARSQS